jgi:anaerobic selenocysteine-containing dehydrogenase
LVGEIGRPGTRACMSSEKRKGERLNLSRRSFLKASGATGLVVFAAGGAKPAARSSDSSTPPPPVVGEGVTTEKWINSSCLNCPARCATSIRVVNGKAVRITGNRLSQVAEGDLCPRGHIGLQVLYDSARVSTPLKRTNPEKGRDVDPGWKPVSWSDALDEVTGRLRALRDGGAPEQLAMFTGLNARSDEDLVARFAAAWGTPNLIANDTLENEAVRVGRWLADGNYSHVAYDLGRASYVLAFGASIVESERPLARNLRMWGKMRRERPTRAKVVVIDPRYSVTAAKADQWLPINPGTDGALALSIAGVLISEGLYDRDFVSKYTTGFDSFKASVLDAYRPETVANVTGIKADTIRQIARDFGATRPALAWVGRGVAGWPGGALTSYAIFCLNALVGAINAPGGVLYQEEPHYRPMPAVVDDGPARDGRKKLRLDGRALEFSSDQPVAANMAAAGIIAGQPYPVKIAIGFNSNFNMTAPGAPIWNEALKKLPYYVHVTPFVSEMALYADILLPATTFLEQWGYDHSPPGSGFAEVRIKQPVVAVESSARSAGDIVFELARRLGGTVGSSFGDLGSSMADSFDGPGKDTRAFVKYRTADILPWTEFAEKGVWVGAAYRYGSYEGTFKTPSGKFEFVSRFLAEWDKSLSSMAAPGVPRYVAPVFLGDEKQFPLLLGTYQPLLTMEGGSQNYPWAQEVFLAMHGVGWTSFAEINRETAHSLHIKDGDDVWVESRFGRLKLKARVIEWVNPAVVAIARGQGHYAPGKWQNGIGVNPNDIVGVDYDRFSGQSALFNTRVKVYRA